MNQPETTIYKTNLRQNLLEIFRLESRPLSASEIISTLKGRALSPNKTSVYRQLENMEKSGVLKIYDFLDGKRRYELGKQDNHAHVICTNCTKVTCLDLHQTSLLDSLKEQASSKGFVVERVDLEIFGKCQNCV